MEQGRMAYLLLRLAPIGLLSSDPSQQRGAPELSLSERVTKLNELLESSPARFLERFGEHLRREDLELFEPANNPEAAIQLATLRSRFAVAKSRTSKSKDQLKIKNRRFNYLGRVLRRSDYFSLASMRERQPFLYEQYMERKVPPHLPKFSAETTLSDRLLASYDAARVEQKRQADEELENQRMAAEEDEEDEEEEEEDTLKIESKREPTHVVTVVPSKSRKRPADGDDNDSEEKQPEGDVIEVPLDEDEEYFRQTQFQKAMEQRFLSGADTEWVDYKEIDTNLALDDIDQEGRDAEEKYFDDD